MRHKEEELYQMVSGYYLCDDLPEKWYDMEDEPFYEWLEENAWEPFEYCEGRELWEIIDSNVYGMKQFINIYWGGDYAM